MLRLCVCVCVCACVCVCDTAVASAASEGSRWLQVLRSYTQQLRQRCTRGRAQRTRTRAYYVCLIQSNLSKRITRLHTRFYTRLTALCPGLPR